MGDASVISEIPLIPDGEQAREWAVRELADPVYQAAQPTWFDRAAQAGRDALASLFSPDVAPEWAAVLALVAAILAIAVIVIAILVWGLPCRTSSRSHRSGELFGDIDYRTAEGLRAAADAARRRGDWDTAIVLRFRAAARGLDERELVDLAPGTTSRQFAVRADALLVPGSAEVRRAALVFDDIRYLQRPGTEAGYGLVAAADSALARVVPAASAEPAGVSAP
ncbi:DUF4129 domain-containing protein [Microbacterium schleiferi]|uniref:DUF4129 domain-containing protein n=1 Tax=Microbacterium schleiferi TaxID=69362 RepID=A0A7S8MXZ0_9MICO|nr:DUF4129 domain-containing protein [Microbacterium schleiferi]QPE05225.1 DUF4129 domain-containing protein [Microbacterium schleiferi]